MNSREASRKSRYSRNTIFRKITPFQKKFPKFPIQQKNCQLIYNNGSPVSLRLLFYSTKIIRSNILKSFDGFHREIVTLQKHHPSHESSVGIFCAVHVLQRLVVCLQHKRYTVQIQMTSLDSPYNRQALFLDCRVVALRT